MQEYSSFRIKLEGAGKYPCLGVAAQSLHFLRCVGVVNMDSFLLDDGTFVEVGGGEVGGCADNLDAPFIRLVVGFCSLETGQE